MPLHKNTAIYTHVEKKGVYQDSNFALRVHDNDPEGKPCIDFLLRASNGEDKREWISRIQKSIALANKFYQTLQNSSQYTAIHTSTTPPSNTTTTSNTTDDNEKKDKKDKKKKKRHSRRSTASNNDEESDGDNIGSNMSSPPASPKQEHRDRDTYKEHDELDKKDKLQLSLKGYCELNLSRGKGFLLIQQWYKW